MTQTFPYPARTQADIAPRGSVRPEHRELVETLLINNGSASVARTLAVSGIAYSYPAIDRVRREMAKNGIRPPLKQPADQSCIHAPQDHAEAGRRCDALHFATLSMFRRTAEREGITLAEAGVRALYGQAAFERWRAQA